MCLMGTFTPSSNIHMNRNVENSGLKLIVCPLSLSVLLVMLWPLVYILDSIIWAFGSSLPPIHTPPQPSSHAHMNTIYYGLLSISSVQLVGSVAASCSSFHISSKNCLTAVDFDRFTHAGSRPSTALTAVNIPFVTEKKIVMWQHFTMTERNVLKIYSSLAVHCF